VLELGNRAGVSSKRKEFPGLLILLRITCLGEHKFEDTVLGDTVDTAPPGFFCISLLDLIKKQKQENIPGSKFLFFLQISLLSLYFPSNYLIILLTPHAGSFILNHAFIEVGGQTLDRCFHYSMYYVSGISYH
jgi:hypothetical protein